VILALSYLIELLSLSNNITHGDKNIASGDNIIGLSWQR
jgi:hypothetical protein